MSPADLPSSLPPILASAEVVLVSYRSRGHVETLLSLWPDDLRVVLVDNSDTPNVAVTGTCPPPRPELCGRGLTLSP